jgi:hypothetical protein
VAGVADHWIGECTGCRGVACGLKGRDVSGGNENRGEATYVFPNDLLQC